MTPNESALCGHLFRWRNKSGMLCEDDTLTLYAPAHTDYFNSPIGRAGTFPAPIATAPLYYTELTGDFVFRVRVGVDFRATFDAGAVLIYENENVWAKLAFEKSDRPGGCPAVISVVTNRVSDDCHGAEIRQAEIGFQVSRVDDCFAFHYTLDEENWQMARIFTLPVGKTVKIGLEAQAPQSGGGIRRFRGLSIRSERLADIRAGK